MRNKDRFAFGETSSDKDQDQETRTKRQDPRIKTNQGYSPSGKTGN